MNIFAQGDCKQAGTAPVYFVVGMAGFIPSPNRAACKERVFLRRQVPPDVLLSLLCPNLNGGRSIGGPIPTACITALFGSKPTARPYPSPTFAMRIPRNQPISSGLRKCKKEEKNKI
jgi:hypothetical protein